MAWFERVRPAGGQSIAAFAGFLREALNVRDWPIREAERHYRAGRVDAAESAYRALLQDRPDLTTALAGLGRLLLRERRFEEATGIWTRLVELQPHRPEPSFQLARALHRNGKFEAAAAQYLRVVSLDPLHEKAFIGLEQLTDRLLHMGARGTTAIEAASQLAQQLLSLDRTPARVRVNALGVLAAKRAQGEPNAALEHWERMAAQDPRAIEPRLRLAQAYRHQHRHDRARGLFEEVLALDPNNAEALVGVGMALETVDTVAAIRHFSDWSRRRPRDVTPRLELARLYQKSSAGDHAEAAYRNILGPMSDDPAALTRLAQVLSRNLQRVEPALDLWHRLADRDPRAPQPLVQRAHLLERVRRPAEAEAEYRAALSRAPKDEAALLGLARLLFGQSRHGEAIGVYEALHRLKPRRADVLLGLGRCHERLDRPEEALETYEKVAALDPANMSAQQYRGRLLRLLGRTEEAIRLWRESCQRNPLNADAWYELVFMLATVERDEEALAALDRAEAVLPASAASWIRLGQAAQAGQFDARAVGFFERAVAAEPRDAGHRAKLGQHYLRRGVLDGAFHQLHASRELKPQDVGVARHLVEAVHALNAIGVDPLALERAPSDCGAILVPEALFSRVREIADHAIVPYVPVPRRVVAVSSSLAGGGAERQLVNMLRGLSDPAWKLELSLFCVSLARRTRRDFFLPLLQDVPVEIVTVDEAALGTWLAAPEVAPYARLIKAFPPDMVAPIAFWLAEFSRRRPQVVHAWQDATNLTAVVAALLAGVPRIVLSTRSVRPDNPRRRLKRHMQHAYRAVLGHPSVVLSNNSRAGADDYADWLGIAPERIDVIHNGIDFDLLAARVDLARVREIRSRLRIPTDAPIVGSAFRMSEEKRPLLWVEVAAEVARRHRRAHFVVYGDGPMRADMQRLAERLGIADRLHLPGAESELASSYRAMNVVLLTSRHEGLPNVLLEAQSLGVPVVAPDVGGVSEAIRPGVTGWAVADADAGRLAERVLLCLTDAAWAAQAAVDAPRFVRERFGIDTMLKRTLDVYGLEAP